MPHPWASPSDRLFPLRPVPPALPSRELRRHWKPLPGCSPGLCFGRSAGALCWLHAWSRQPPASITATSAALQAAFVPLFILSILLIFHSPYLSGKIQPLTAGVSIGKPLLADPYLSFRSQKRRASLKSLSNAYFILLYYSRKKCENHLFSSDRRGVLVEFCFENGIITLYDFGEVILPWIKRPFILPRRFIILREKPISATATARCYRCDCQIQENARL